MSTRPICYDMDVTFEEYELIIDGIWFGLITFSVTCDAQMSGDTWHLSDVAIYADADRNQCIGTGFSSSQPKLSEMIGAHIWADRAVARRICEKATERAELDGFYAVRRRA